MPFTLITECYVLVLIITLICRIALHRRINANPWSNQNLLKKIKVLHMFLCLGFLSFAICSLPRPSPTTVTCWQPVTLQTINYYVEVGLVAVPAIFLCFIIACVAICSPCILNRIITTWWTRRQARQVGRHVVEGLAKRKFNPSLFKAQSECAICLDKFTTKSKVSPLACDIKHYFHTKCISQWIQTKNQCPLCRQVIRTEDLRELSPKIDQLLA